MEKDSIVLVLDPKNLDRDAIRSGLAAAGCPATPVWVESLSPAPAGVDPSKVRFLLTTDHRLRGDAKDTYPNLEMASLGFTGLDGVDVDALQARGVALHYAPGYATQSVAELNLLLALALCRKLVQADANVRKGVFGKGVIPGDQLSGRTVGLVGTGAIGMRTAELFRAVGCPVIGWSRTRRRDFTAHPFQGRYVDSLLDLAAQADVIVLAVPLTKATRGIVDGNVVAAMKRGALLVNTARSELVDRPALEEGLRSNRVGGAALDVFDAEPVKSDDPLLAVPNLLLTPHVGFQTREALAGLARVMTENVGNHLSGDPARRARNRVGSAPSAPPPPSDSPSLPRQVLYAEGSQACRNYSGLTKDVRLIGSKLPLVLVVPLGAALLGQGSVGYGSRLFTVLLATTGLVLSLVCMGVALIDWHYQSAFEAVRDRMKSLEEEANVVGWATVHHKERFHKGEAYASYMPFWIWTAIGVLALAAAPWTAWRWTTGEILVSDLLAAAVTFGAFRAYRWMARNSPCGRELWQKNGK